MNDKKYHTVGIASNSNRKIIETEGKLIPLIHIYYAAHFPGLIQALKSGLVKLVFHMWVKCQALHISVVKCQTLHISKNLLDF